MEMSIIKLRIKSVRDCLYLIMLYYQDDKKTRNKMLDSQISKLDKILLEMKEIK